MSGKIMEVYIMNELEMQELLTDALNFNDEENENNQIKSIKSFQDAIILTSNKGLIIKMNDGSEFQITIIQSRKG